jgi:ATP-binding protein involved in chromosome partitioning
MPPKISLPNIGYVIAVASGKGGVGKSTVAVNLAAALQMQNTRVGLMDADIYGPSVPRMMGVPGTIDQVTTPLPLEQHGIKLMSMGFLVNPTQAVIWRGPMVHKALTDFLTRIDWGELDFLVIDLPPGTGDAQITLSQNAPVSGAVIVTTPQEVSQTVAFRGLEMFRQVRVPILGIVENMSFLLGADGQKTYIFGQGGGRKLAEQTGVPFLGEVPIDPRVAECGDGGEPVVKKYPDSPAAKAYQALAVAVVRELHNASSTTELPEAEI